MAHFKVTAVAGLAAVALSGCSWLGLGGHDKAGSGLYADQYGGAYGYTPGQAYGAGHAAAGGPSHCQIPTPAHPVPAGCDPAAVTIGVPGAGGFSQTPQFGAVGSPSFASGAYGTHVGGNVHAPIAAKEASYRKPRIRGFVQSSVEKSVSGEFLDFNRIGAFDPAGNYDPDDFRQLSLTSPVVDNMDGTSTFTADVYTAVVGSTNQPSISYDDVYSVPLTVSGGLEYIVSPHATVFANAGYAYSEGNGGPVTSVQGDLIRRESTFTTDNATGGLISEVQSPTFASRNEQVEIATYDLDFTDLRRIDLEAGGRYFFEPMAKMGMPGITPFIGAAAGASHHNSQSFTVSQTQARFQDAFVAGGSTDGQFYDVVPPQLNGEARVELYDAQWVPRGRLNAGLEWQAHPSMAIAFETGLHVEGGKRYAPTGERGNANVSIPLTVRGSYNF